MKNHVRVAVIGGGVVGCSLLYHLAKKGCTDVALFERSELTSGSSWHAAGATHVLHDVKNISMMHRYSINLYQSLEEETGQSCGLHRVGGIYLAFTPERLNQLKIQRSKAKYLNIDFEFITLKEAIDLNPLLNLKGCLGALYEPNESHLDPSGVTHAFAKGARMSGADIYRFCPVIETNPQADGSWEIVTPEGICRADTVVNAGGLWAREVAALAGIQLPLQPLEHQYFVTDPIPELEVLDREIPLLHDNDGGYYLRQEAHGLLIGAYERNGRFWAENGTPKDFGHELLSNDLDRIEEYTMRAIQVTPCLERAGVKRVVNGPMIWTPDTVALAGPIPELRNYFVATGMIPGFSQSGGLGKALADWILDGDPGMDLWALDPARFGDYATTRRYRMERAMDNYGERYRIFFPYDERAAGRPIRMRPIYEIQKTQGAVFGSVFGWEIPLWFARSDERAVDIPSFRRTNWFDAVGEETRAVRDGVGLIDISHFAKYLISGPMAEAWLNRVLANRMPTENGRTVLSPMLNDRGNLVGDFTVTKLAEDRYWMIGSGAAERYHFRWWSQFLPSDGVTVESMTTHYAGFSVTGPRARELLATVAQGDVSNEEFGFHRCRELELESSRAIVIRISFAGDLGYEIYFPSDYQITVYRDLLKAGTAFDMRLVGARALNSLRLEKGYGSWGHEITAENNAYECGLGAFVNLNKGNFIGRDAAVAQKSDGVSTKLCVFEIEANDADAVGDEPILLDGEIVGSVTSGGFGHYVNKSIALGFLSTEHIDPTNKFVIEIVGDPMPATLLTEPSFDPSGKRMR